MVYAQGIGPLLGKQAEELTRGFFQLANAITVRDDASMALVNSWGLSATRTADPVWRLRGSQIPVAVQSALPPGPNLYGLSLRPAANFTDSHVQTLASLLVQNLPADAHMLLLPLQEDQDTVPLKLFDHFWRQSGRDSTMLDVKGLQLPSQWMSVLGHCRGLIGMRLHAIILALKAGIPVAGIAYDPKVSHVLEEFKQPCLILTKDVPEIEWSEGVKSFVSGADELVDHSRTQLEIAENLSCQNFELLAKILSMQRGC